jgi:hypothetical protein
MLHRLERKVSEEWPMARLLDETLDLGGDAIGGFRIVAIVRRR